MSELAAFQDRFIAALQAPSAKQPPGLSVYRNTIAKGCVDSLRSNFPTVERLVGEAWFTACAQVFVEVDPPRSPSLLAYGGAFPEFLAAFAPAAELSYLRDVALLDWLWLEAHAAPDAPVLTAQDALRLSPDWLNAHPIALHPAARFTWCPTPAASIWLANRAAAEPCALDPEWKGEGLLFTRPAGAVLSMVLDEAGHALLQGLSQGLPLPKAIASVPQTADFDIAGFFRDAIALGAFGAPETLSEGSDDL
jgi:hypothetical protein